MERVEAYKCSYCKMLSRFKWRTVKHEAETCKKNPSRKSCLSCINLFKRKNGTPACKVEGGWVPDDNAGEGVWFGINQIVNCDDFLFRESTTILDEPVEV